MLQNFHANDGVVYTLKGGLSQAALEVYCVWKARNRVLYRIFVDVYTRHLTGETHAVELFLDVSSSSPITTWRVEDPHAALALRYWQHNFLKSHEVPVVKGFTVERISVAPNDVVRFCAGC
jgi:hypothetical protein